MGGTEYAAADAWLERTGLAGLIGDTAAMLEKGATGAAGVDGAFEKVFNRFVDAWQDVKTYGEAVADVMTFRAIEDVVFPMTRAAWLAFAGRASFYEAREKAEAMGIRALWDCEHAKTPDGYYQVRGGVDYAIAKSLAAAPYADLLWMETKTADLHEARRFAAAIHAQWPDKMLAYNLSPSFNWDTTGMRDEDMRRFPEELGKLSLATSSTSSPTAATRSTAWPARSSPAPSGRTACSRSHGCSGSSGCSNRHTKPRRRSSAARAPTPP